MRTPTMGSAAVVGALATRFSRFVRIRALALRWRWLLEVVVFAAIIIGIALALTHVSPVAYMRYRDTSDPLWREKLWAKPRGPWRHEQITGGSQWFGSEQDPLHKIHCQHFPELCQ